MKKITLTILILTVSPYGYASEWFEGENLLTSPIPNEKQYEAFVKKEDGWQSRLWQSKEKGGGDSYVVNIVKGGGVDLINFKKTQDSPGEAACKEFNAVAIDQKNRNGYKSVFWKTTCKIKGMEIKSIQLAISGRDSLYHIRKLWKVSVSEEEQSIWLKSIQAISLCDTREKENPCPSGFNKVDS